MGVETIIVRANPVTLWEPGFEHEFERERFTVTKMSIRDIGWFYEARFQIINPTKLEALDWLNNGPGREVIFKNDDGNTDWEGYINSVTLTKGDAEVKNSLTQLSNEVWTRYQDLGTGTVARSTPQLNAKSQSRYGIKEWILNGGEMPAADADQLTKIWLDRNYWATPQLQRITLGRDARSEGMVLEFYCLGWWHTLNWRVYNQTLLTGTVAASVLVNDIIGTRAGTKVNYPATWDETADFDTGRSDFSSLSPAWDQQAQEATAEFDTTGTAGAGAFGANAASVRIGTNGFYSTVAGAGDQAYGEFTGPTAETFVIWEGWFYPDSISIPAGSTIEIGGSDNFWNYLSLYNDGFNLYLIPAYRIDSGAFLNTGTILISNAWHHVRMVWKASSAPAANDGYVLCYVDGVLEGSATGIDNDTHTIASLYFGVINSSAATNGTFRWDECQWSDGPAAPPAIIPHGAFANDYVAAWTVFDTNASYGLLSGPTNEKEITVEVEFDPNSLAMADGDAFRLIDATGSGTGGDFFYVRIRRSGGAYHVRLLYDTDTATDVDASGLIEIPDAPTLVRVVARASSGAGNDDGAIFLFVNNQMRASVTGIDNDTHDADTVLVGTVASVDAGTSGTLLVRQARWSNDVVIVETTETGVGQFIKSVSISTNSTPHTQVLDADRRGGDLIESIARVGFTNNVPAVCGVRENREFFFEPAADIGTV